LARHGIDDRVRTESGSFFTAIPPGGDLYVLKTIIHDWPNEQAVKILHRLREATGPGAAAVLVEQLIRKHNRDFLGKWTDLEMLICHGGRERTATEYRDLLTQAGFQITRIVPTASPLSIVEARRRNHLSTQKTDHPSRCVSSLRSAKSDRQLR
jgi:hypothetical protein